MLKLVNELLNVPFNSIVTIRFLFEYIIIVYIYYRFVSFVRRECLLTLQRQRGEEEEEAFHTGGR